LEPVLAYPNVLDDRFGIDGTKKPWNVLVEGVPIERLEFGAAPEDAAGIDPFQHRVLVFLGYVVQLVDVLWQQADPGHLPGRLEHAAVPPGAKGGLRCGCHFVAALPERVHELVKIEGGALVGIPNVAADFLAEQIGPVVHGARVLGVGESLAHKGRREGLALQLSQIQHGDPGKVACLVALVGWPGVDLAPVLEISRLGDPLHNRRKGPRVIHGVRLGDLVVQRNDPAVKGPVVQNDLDVKAGFQQRLESRQVRPGPVEFLRGQQDVLPLGIGLVQKLVKIPQQSLLLVRRAQEFRFGPAVLVEACGQVGHVFRVVLIEFDLSARADPEFHRGHDVVVPGQEIGSFLAERVLDDGGSRLVWAGVDDRLGFSVVGYVVPAVAPKWEIFVEAKDKE